MVEAFKDEGKNFSFPPFASVLEHFSKNMRNPPADLEKRLAELKEMGYPYQATNQYIRNLIYLQDKEKNDEYCKTNNIVLSDFDQSFISTSKNPSPAFSFACTSELDESFFIHTSVTPIYPLAASCEEKHTFDEDKDVTPYVFHLHDIGHTTLIKDNRNSFTEKTGGTSHYEQYRFMSFMRQHIENIATPGIKESANLLLFELLHERYVTNTPREGYENSLIERRVNPITGSHSADHYNTCTPDDIVGGLQSARESIEANINKGFAYSREYIAQASKLGDAEKVIFEATKWYKENAKENIPNNEQDIASQTNELANKYANETGREIKKDIPAPNAPEVKATAELGESNYMEAKKIAQEFHGSNLVSENTQDMVDVFTKLSSSECKSFLDKASQNTEGSKEFLNQLLSPDNLSRLNNKQIIVVFNHIKDNKELQTWLKSQSRKTSSASSDHTLKQLWKSATSSRWTEVIETMKDCLFKNSLDSAKVTLWNSSPSERTENKAIKAELDKLSNDKDTMRLMGEFSTSGPQKTAKANSYMLLSLSSKDTFSGPAFNNAVDHACKRAVNLEQKLQATHTSDHRNSRGPS